LSRWYKYSENQKIDGDIYSRYDLRFLLFFLSCASYPYSTQPTAKRGEGNEDEETPVPPAIEEIGGCHNKEILQPQFPFKDKPIEQKYYWKKNKKFK
jgi:hypothetical protein